MLFLFGAGFFVPNEQSMPRVQGILFGDNLFTFFPTVHSKQSIDRSTQLSVNAMNAIVLPPVTPTQ